MKRAIFIGNKKFTPVAIAALLFVFGVSVHSGFMVQNAIAEDGIPELWAAHTITATITGYSSDPFETDDTPFITASGGYVRDGVVANNCLPFGARVFFPEVFGTKVFVVEDRKHSRYGCEWFDVWFSEKRAAKHFGIIRDIEALAF